MKSCLIVLSVFSLCFIASTEAAHRKVAAGLSRLSIVANAGPARNASPVRVKDARYAGDCSATVYQHSGDCSIVQFKAPDCARVVRAEQVVGDCGKVEETRYHFERDCGKPAGNVTIKGRSVDYDKH